MLQSFTIKLMLLKFPVRFCFLVVRLSTNQDRNGTKTKEVAPFPEYFFSCDRGLSLATNAKLSRAIPENPLYKPTSLRKILKLKNNFLKSRCILTFLYFFFFFHKLFLKFCSIQKVSWHPISLCSSVMFSVNFGSFPLNYQLINHRA